MNNQKKSSPLDMALMLRLLVAGYLLYLLYKVVSGYVAGGADAPSLLVLLIAIVILGGGAVTIALLSYFAWKKEKASQETQQECLPEETPEELPEETE